MRSFWSYVSNGTFSVGCTGQTVYVYDKSGNELAKFKDLIYAYLPVISPDGKQFVVKSTDGRLAVYSLETLSLIKKFRFSKVNCAQDGGCCFSSDGSLFYNVESHIDDLHCSISVYEAGLFSKISQYDFDAADMITEIEYDAESDTCFFLGNVRGDHGYRYVAKFSGNDAHDAVRITEEEWWFYTAYMPLKASGFTKKKYEWSHHLDADLEELKTVDHSLAKLYQYRSENIVD